MSVNQTTTLPTAPSITQEGVHPGSNTSPTDHMNGVQTTASNNEPNMQDKDDHTKFEENRNEEDMMSYDSSTDDIMVDEYGQTVPNPSSPPRNMHNTARQTTGIRHMMMNKWGVQSSREHRQRSQKRNGRYRAVWTQPNFRLPP
jgi:hypothetical protein